MGELNYGGQAVMEGVMMRGSQGMAVAVRGPSGEIIVHSEDLSPTLYRGWVNRVPFVRALTSLWDVLVLGMRTLLYSANVALDEEDVEFSGPVAWGTVGLSLAFGIGFFFVVPLLLVGLVDPYIRSSLVSNLVEGAIRMLLFVGYVAAIGQIPEISRVFRYHGAEHKTINAYESGVELTPEAVSRFSTAHFRCGTAFTLTVMVIAILIFALLGRPPLPLRIASRVLLIPVVAGVAYEFIRFTARRQGSLLVRVIAAPNLAMQRLTTREPDSSMLEVAIAALKRVLEMEQSPEEQPPC